MSPYGIAFLKQTFYVQFKRESNGHSKEIISNLWAYALVAFAVSNPDNQVYSVIITKPNHLKIPVEIPFFRNNVAGQKFKTNKWYHHIIFPCNIFKN